MSSNSKAPTLVSQTKREKMKRLISPILGKAQKALQDLNLLQILQSEIAHELSSNPFQEVEISGLGDFTVDWDSSQSQDVILRRKCENGDEVFISALLGSLSLELERERERETESVFPRDVLMKVCVKKPGLESVLHFDCQLHQNDSEFDIHNAYYLQSPTTLTKFSYQGPEFNNLESRLQDALKEYLISKGVGQNLTHFLRLHLHKKEQGQYVEWLKKLESSLAKAQ